jgi:hypothetical protein
MGSRILKVIMFGKSPHILTLLIGWLKDLVSARKGISRCRVNYSSVFFFECTRRALISPPKIRIIPERKSQSMSTIIPPKLP